MFSNDASGWCELFQGSHVHLPSRVYSIQTSDFLLPGGTKAGVTLSNTFLMTSEMRVCSGTSSLCPMLCQGDVCLQMSHMEVAGEK